MAADTPVILTEKRREILDTYDPESSAHRNRLYQTKERTQTVLEELTEIAKSDNIDNSDVFDPGTLADEADIDCTVDGVADELLTVDA